MEELQVIETTSGRQFKPWATKNDVQDPASVTAIASEIASGKQAIASAINAKGGSASATESFSELAQDIQDTPTSGVLSSGIVQSAPFSFLDYVCRAGAHPFSEIDDDSVTVINRASAFQRQTQLLKVKMSVLGIISVNSVFEGCSALQVIDMPNLTTITSAYGTFQNCSALYSITLPTLAIINAYGTFYGCSALQNVTLSSLTALSGASTFYGCSALQNVTLSSLTALSGASIFYGCSALQNVTFGTLTAMSEPFDNGKPNLRNITIGQDTNINLPFQLWTATNVIAEGQSGIDELNSNLQTNLIAKLYQGGGKILRLGAALYDVTTQETRDMVTAKGWTLQRG